MTTTNDHPKAHRALLVAFHFPPLHGSSGIQRTLALARHLPANGWQPAVLSASEQAYRETDPSSLALIPEGTPVKRVFCRDTARSLSIRGRYPRMLALPDAWSTWLLGGLMGGAKFARAFRPELVWSTYPIATAHLIGALCKKVTGAIWVADFRDLMIDAAWPENPWQRRAHAWVERLCARHADAVTFTAPGALEDFAERYPLFPRDRLHVVDNGYDESIFSGLPAPAARSPGAALELLHSGIVYSEDRDPTKLLQALARINADSGARPVKIVFRASRADSLLERLALSAGCTADIEMRPPVDYRSALSEMFASDGLLVLQGQSCDRQIPAKIYEYMRTDRPIVGAVSITGNTHRVLKESNTKWLADIDDADELAEVLRDWRDAVVNGHASGCGAAAPRFTREASADQFAKIFASTNFRA